MKVLSLWQKLFLRELTSTCLFHHICSFQTAFQGDEMTLLSAISVQRSPAPHAPRPARLICSVSAWGWSPGSAALESAFPSRLLNWNIFTCLSMSCSSVNCLFMSTFLLALKNLFVVHFQEPLFYYRHSSFICRLLYKYLFFQIYYLHIVCLWLLFPQNIYYSCRVK